MCAYSRGIYELPVEGSDPLEPPKNSVRVSVNLLNPVGLYSALNLKHAGSFRQLPHNYISSFRNHSFANPGSTTRIILCRLIQH